MIDHGLIQALHVERLRRDDLGAEEREPHSIFQTSTLDALLGGAYDGDCDCEQHRDGAQPSRASIRTLTG